MGGRGWEEKQYMTLTVCRHWEKKAAWFYTVRGELNGCLYAKQGQAIGLL